MKLSQIHSGEKFITEARINTNDLFRFAKEIATRQRMKPDFLEDIIFVLSRQYMDIDHRMFEGVQSARDLVTALKKVQESGNWPPTTNNMRLREEWLKQRYAGLFQQATRVEASTKANVKPQLMNLLKTHQGEAEGWRESVMSPQDLVALLKKHSAGGSPAAPPSSAPVPRSSGTVPLIGSDDPVLMSR